MNKINWKIYNVKTGKITSMHRLLAIIWTRYSHKLTKMSRAKTKNVKSSLKKRQT